MHGSNCRVVVVVFLLAGGESDGAGGEDAWPEVGPGVWAGWGSENKDEAGEARAAVCGACGAGACATAIWILERPRAWALARASEAGQSAAAWGWWNFARLLKGQT